MKNDLAGPWREVVYIFEREGDRGGGYWWLVLACGHAIARKRYVPKRHLLFKPLEEKFAPKKCQCYWCGWGTAEIDPWVTIKRFGGPDL